MEPSQYIYRLGHQPALGLLELSTVMNRVNPMAKLEQWSKDWVSSDFSLSVQGLGSTVYRARIIEEFKPHFVKEVVKEKLQHVFSELYLSNPSQKVAVASTFPLRPGDIIFKAKNAGYKKVNVLERGLEPNYGNWKQTKTWVLLVQIELRAYIAVIEDFVDQEFWKTLDEKLPHSDMRRGIMNMKLGRTLLNLAGGDKFWDPFCGQGRTLISGFDMMNKLIFSDSDSVVLPEVVENCNSGNYFWSRKIGVQYTKPEIMTATHDVQNAIPQEILDKLKDWKIDTIVTEGFLGVNFSALPDESTLEKQHKFIYSLWRNFLGYLEQTSINNIVFCIPAYQLGNGKWLENHHLMQYLEKYKQFNIIGSKKLIYARANTITGHHIITLKRI